MEKILEIIGYIIFIPIMALIFWAGATVAPKKETEDGDVHK